jgi:hypothetical protein
MCAELLIAREMVALDEEVDVELSENRGETVDVVEFGPEGAIRYAQSVAKRLPPIGNGRNKETVAMNPNALGGDFAGRRFDDRHFLCRREDRSYTNPGGSLMHAEEGERIVMTPIDNGLDLKVRLVRHARSSPSWPKFRESL